MKKTLIIIDDEPLIKKYLSFMLEKHFIVHSFENAENALTFLNKKKHVDYILSDYMMENVNGLEFLSEVISNDLLKNPVNNFCFMTAYDNHIVGKLNKTGCRIISKENINTETIIQIFKE